MQRSQYITNIKSSLRKFPIIFKKSLEIRQSMERQKTFINILSPDSALEDEHLGEKANSFYEKYSLEDKIGEGANGFVYRCLFKPSGKHYAVKIQSINQEQIRQIKKNYLILHNINHPAVMKYRALHVSPQTHQCYLVTELLNYPNLAEAGPFSQKEVKIIAKAMLGVLKAIHEQNLCHRDIKPQNILFDREHSKIKLIDFGISKRTFLRGQRRDMLTITGTTYYMAPEMYLGGGYDQRIDLWALGVTIYYLIAGCTPFAGQYHHDTVNNIIRGEFTFGQEWNKYDFFAKDFVSRLLRPKDDRMTIKQAQKHFWLQNIQTKKRKLSKHQSQYQQINDLFHSQQYLSANATSKEEGESTTDKSLYRNINLITLNEYGLEDSSDEDSIVTSPYACDCELKQFPV